MTNEFSAVIEEITARNKTRRYAIKQQQRMDRALEAHIVFDIIGMPREATEKQRKEVWLKAKRMIGEASARLSEDRKPTASPIAALVAANTAARSNYDAMRDEAEKRMENLAKELPVWEAFAKNLRGFGALGLAQIVAEANARGKALSDYPDKSKLWKRLGLAVIDGKRQGAPGAKASAELWIKHGYNPERRSVVWNIGQSLFKHDSGRIDKDTGEVLREPGRYRQAYDRRKTYELARGMSKIVAHNRSVRYLEKKLIADLLSAWRRVDLLRCADKAMRVLSPRRTY